MRWLTAMERHVRKYGDGEWNRWFAWYPVTVGGEWVWREWVWRKHWCGVEQCRTRYIDDAGRMADLERQQRINDLYQRLAAQTEPKR